MLHQTGSRRRPFRRLILSTAILPVALAVQAFGVDWSGPVTLTINPTISAGLQEGRIDGNPFDLFSPNPLNGPNTGLGVGVSLGIRMGQSTLNFGDGSTLDPDNFWSDNRTWIYTGEINSGPTGRLSFAESIDDSTQIKIDGIVVLQDGTLDPSTTGVLNFAPNTFHAIEVRLGNGFNNAGPVTINNFTPTYGFGFSQTGATGTDGANYVAPVDPGTGALFHFVTAEAADANQDINVLGATNGGGGTAYGTTVTLSKVTNDHLTENSITFAPTTGNLITLMVNGSTPGGTLRSLNTVLAVANTKTVTITGNADFAPGALSTGPTPGAATLTGINLVKTGVGSLILDNPTNALAGTTIRVADGMLSILGSGGTTTPVSTLITAIEIGGAGAVAPVLRIGSSGATGTTFNNLFKTTQTATLEHLTGTTDTISGATFSITSGKTLTVNVAAGGLAINGAIADPSSPISNPTSVRGGTLKKMGNNTTLKLSGAMRVAGLNAAEGRLEVLGQLNLNSNPIIGANATLSLQNTSLVTPNIITFNPVPTTISIPTGTLEGLPGAFGAATNVLSLTGGTLNLGVAGLTAHLYDTGAAAAQAAFGGPLNPARTFTDYLNYFAGRGAGTVASTGAGGVAQLSFGSGFANTAMFAVLAPNYTRTDDIVSRLNGKIIITTPGLYTFATDSDDGSMLYIDGATVVSNNASQAHVRRTGQVQLSAGLHDIDIGYYEGTGLNGLIVDYAGPDTADAQTVIPNSVLLPSTDLQWTFQNPITISQNAVINAFAVSVPSVKLTVANRTLTVNGPRMDIGVLDLTTGGAGTYTINATTLGGQVDAKSILDGGNAVTLVNHGLGALIIESSASPQLQNAGSSVTVDVGPLGLVRGTGEGNPTGNATVTVSSGKMILSSKGGDQTFPFPNTFGGVDRSITATQLGSGAAGAVGAPIRTTISGNMTLPAGTTLSLSSSKNYILAVGGVTGAGSVNVQGGAVESAAPINLTGTAQITVTGTKFTTQGLAAGAITVTDSTLTNTGTLSSGIAALSVTRSTVTANGGTSADSISIADSFYSSTGALATGAGGIVLTGGTFKSSTLQLRGGTISGGVIAAQNGIIHVAEGTTVAATSATFTGNVSPTGLLARFISRGGTGALYAGNTQAGVLAMQTLPAAAQTFLTNALSFVPNADATVSTFFGGGVNTATFAMGFFGNFTAPTSGSYRFQIAQVDDTAGFWIDLDGDNVFETAGSSGNELASQIGAVGNGGIGTVTLVGGRSYNVAMSLEDTGGASGVEARFALPGEPSLSVVNPSDPAQAGLWTYALPNQVNVDAGAELDIEAINGNVDVLVKGRLEFDGAGSSTINSLTIGAGGVVEIGAGAPAPAEGFAESAAVPEPGVASLMLLGALGVLGRRRANRA